MATINLNTNYNNPELKYLKKVPILTYLESKKSSMTGRKNSINSIDTDIEDSLSTKYLPSYSFSIISYQIGEFVEYTFQLTEHYKILKRNIKKTYLFSTRYSKLEVLDQQFGGMGLPSKKWFGNKSKEFVEKRKYELQAYLNNIANSKKACFYRFIKQIKDGDYNRSLYENFTIQ